MLSTRTDAMRVKKFPKLHENSMSLTSACVHASKGIHAILILALFDKLLNLTMFSNCERSFAFDTSLRFTQPLPIISPLILSITMYVHPEWVNAHKTFGSTYAAIYNTLLMLQIDVRGART